MLMGQTCVACVSLSLALSKIIMRERIHFLDISASSTHVETPDHRYHQGHGQTCVGLSLAHSKIFIWVRNRAQMPSSVSRTCWGADHSLLSPVPPPLPFLSPFGAFYVASLCLFPRGLFFSPLISRLRLFLFELCFFICSWVRHPLTRFFESTMLQIKKPKR